MVPGASLLRAASCAALLLSAALPAAAAGPAILFDSRSCDVGTVTQGEQPSCDFTFSNAGSGELRILRVEPTCGCTSALMSAPELAPGARGSIRVTFDSSNFTGEIAKELTVLSDDPAQPQVPLTLRARVEPEVDLEPRLVTFDAAQPGTARAQLVVLTNRRAEPVLVRQVSAAPATFACGIPAWADAPRPLSVEPWDRVVIQVGFTPPSAIAMPIAGECTLEIAGPRKSLFTVKLLALPATDP